MNPPDPRFEPVLATLAATWLVIALPATASAEEPPASLPAVTVNGILPSADDTYRVPTATVGPMGDKALLDTPYSISVVPVNLAENQQLQSVRELFRYIPSVQGENIRPQSRGMQAGVVQNTRIDGLNIAATTDYAIEQFERIEVTNGLAGALYGPASPAGTFNYVFKRPTAQPLNALTLAYASRGSLIEHADLSRRFGNDAKFGARLNLLDQSGAGYVEGSDLRRRLASLAVDAHLTASTSLEVDLSEYHYVSTGFPANFSLARGVAFPAPPDPTKRGLGLDWAGDDNRTHIASGRVVHDFGGDWSVSAGLLSMGNARASTVPTYTITSAAGAYTATTVNTTYSLDRVVSNDAALNGKLVLLGTTHDVFLGTIGFAWKRYTPYQTGAITLGKATLDDPIAFGQPALPDFDNRFRAQTTRQQSISLGDTIGFGTQWSVLGAVSQSWIRASNLNRSGLVTSRYDDHGLSPTASVLYKPQSNMTTYLTYADSMQQGDAAPANAANAGDALAPYRSRQWEAGYKIDLARMNVALALYQIERPYAFVGADNVYAVRGRQRNRGIELSANGRLTEDLNTYASTSLMDPRLLDTCSAATSDKQVLGLSKVTFDVLLEYRLPMMKELTLSTNMNHASRRPGNYSNTDFVDGYTLFDLNARYQMRIAERPVALRLALDNVGDKRYWANIAPTGQNGYNSTDNGTGTIGAPRTVRASIEVGL